MTRRTSCNPAGLPVRRIISGGQAGVDRAALDVAIELAIPCGGWCPEGRRAEDGPIDERYPLQETPSPDYAVRTEWNVRDSDGTLILAVGRLSGGTRLTETLTNRLDRPCLVVDPNDSGSSSEVRSWIISNDISTLNVAGPRASQQPDIGDSAMHFLRQVLSAE